MGKKYIIEIPEDKIADFVGSTHFLMPYMMAGHIGHHDTELPIVPYTEPDMEQVKKEAYEKGYENGFIAGHLKAEKSGQSFYEDGHQRGLTDAWEAARKVTQVRKYGGYGDCLGDVFGRTDTSWDVFDYSASEVIEKIRQYEQEKEEIQVGDEIETPSGLKGYVVNFTDDELVHYVSSEGRFGTMGTSAVSKTGRHFPEIAEVLQKMKESE